MDNGARYEKGATTAAGLRPPPQKSRLPAGTWGRGGCRRFVLRLLRTWRWRRRSALRATSEFGALLKPRLVILRRIHDQRALHSVMDQTAKLAANYFCRSTPYQRK